MSVSAPVRTASSAASAAPVLAPRGERRVRPPLPSGLRVGGMAFGNGVLMRAGRYWAWAREDGSILHGEVPVRAAKRWIALPLVRSLVAFFDMLTLSARLHRRNGTRRGLRLLLWLGVMLGAGLALAPLVYEGIDQPLLAGLVLQVAGLLLALVVLQVGMGAEVWRYHGAEHKAVNAYEAGADLADPAVVGAFSRIHDRCGTNLLAILMLLSVFAAPFGQGWVAQLVSLAVAVAGIAAALELFRLLQRHPRWLVSRAALATGKTLQRAVTTRDPGPQHLVLACAALTRVVELESAASSG